MRHKLIAAAFTAVLIAAAQKKDSLEALLGAAIHQEEAEGNLTAAITAYKKVIAQAGANRVLAAKAQFRLGACYERLGDADARNAYEELLRKFGDQADLAAQARARLAALKQPRAAYGIVVRQVWSHTGGDIMGAVSPDGRFLSATDWKTGDLVLRDLATGAMRRVTSNQSPSDGNAEYSVPSPDGKRIAYCWYQGQRGDLRVINTDGAGMKILFNDPAVRYVEVAGWSPDGKYVLGVLQRDNHRRNEMALVAVSDGSVRVMKTMGFPHFENLRFSPDGRYIAYSMPLHGNSRDRDVHLMALDGSADTVLVNHPADDYLLGWSPDSREVVFASNRTGGVSAWRIAVAEGKAAGTPQLIQRNIGLVSPMGTTRQGSLYYSLQETIRDIYTAAVDPDTGAVTAAAAPLAKRFSGGNFQPQWSRDGESLAYQALRPGFDEFPSVVIHEIKSGQERVFRSEIQQPFLGPWFPDGSGVIVRRPGTPGVPFREYKLDARTGALTDPPTVKVPSADGKWSFHWLAGTVVARSEAGGGQKTLFSGESNCCLHGMQPAPAGAGLVAAIDKKLLLLSPDTGERRDLVTLGASEKFDSAWPGSINWLGNRHVVYGKSQDNKVEFWRVAIDGGPPQKLDLGFPAIGELRVHPDGRRVAFTAVDRRKEVWVMENFFGRNGQ